MELKQPTIKRRYANIISSNRTFMELKLRPFLSIRTLFKSSNRTFMELKPAIDSYGKGDEVF